MLRVLAAFGARFASLAPYTCVQNCSALHFCTPVRPLRCVLTYCSTLRALLAAALPARRCSLKLQLFV
jgi:hypothetical protein